MLRDRLDKFNNIMKYKVILYYEIRYFDENQDEFVTFRTFIHGTHIKKMQELHYNRIEFKHKKLAITQEYEQ